MAPRPRVSIRRERVDELFDAATAVPLTAVCAPAGFGKTTAVGDWLASRGRRSTWLTLAATDNDAESLFPRLLDLWGDIAAGCGEAFSVVFDDFQVLTRPASHRAVETMVDRLPAGVQAIVVSRTPPPLRLARRRVAGTVLEVGATDLAFTAVEAETLLDGACGLELGPARVDEITASVAGWPAGLALVAGSLSEAPGRELGPGLELAWGRIDQYLREEILWHLDPDLREFLMRASILDRLHPSLCAALLEDGRAAELLLAAGDARLLSPDPRDADGWVRLQRPFRESLRRELRARKIESLPSLHLRASHWYEGTGMLEEAIEHAGLGEDDHRAAALLEAAARSLDRTEGELRGSLPTRAERRVLALLDRGLTFKEAAADLYLSIHTVKSHAQRLYRRLGVNSRQAAVEVARERGLLD
jgi:LuxR family maltose regulon positive regulatory protein